MSAVYPQFLTENDTVCLVSSAKAIHKLSVVHAVKTLTSWNLNVTVGKNIFKPEHYFGGSVNDRLFDLQTALDNPEIKAIFFVRGGFGIIHLIDKLDFSTFCQYPKWLVGFSDITALLNHVYSNYNTPTIHAEMPINYPLAQDISVEKNMSVMYLKKMLFGDISSISFPCNYRNITGDFSGILFGGNLSVLCSLVGSNSLPNPQGKILLLEDIDEDIYKIDRMLYSLDRAGFISKLTGVLVGGFTDIKDTIPSYWQNYQDIILAHTQQYSIPTVFDVPVGHIERNLPVIIGGKYNCTNGVHNKIILNS